MSISEILNLDDEALEEYFFVHARYNSKNPIRSKYTILFGAKHLFSEDTDSLWEKFVNEIKKYRKQLIREQSKESQDE